MRLKLITHLRLRFIYIQDFILKSIEKSDKNKSIALTF